METQYVGNNFFKVKEKKLFFNDYNIYFFSTERLKEEINILHLFFPLPPGHQMTG